MNPNVIKKKWTLEEDTRIVRLYLKYKTRWSEIARHVDGRTDNQIKNRFNSNLKKRLQDKEFRSLQPAESSCEEGSEDSVTFDGNTNTEEKLKRISMIATKGFSKKNCSTKNDEPTNLINSNMETSMALRTAPVPNIDATVDVNESMPLILSCKQRRNNKLNNYRRSGNGQSIPECQNPSTYDNLAETAGTFPTPRTKDLR